MSRVGKKIITIPNGVSLTVNGSAVNVKGPKGELSRDFKVDTVQVVIEDNEVSFKLVKETIESRAMWGTVSSHVQNMIKGVNEGFTKKLILEGVGFKSEVKDTNLNLALGFSHPVIMPIPTDLTVTAEKNIITVTGIDKELVGSFAAKARMLKKPEPYKGKGFRYEGEVIRRKQGKKSS
jgi:large subunit ribosomal protein L6